MKNLDFFYMHIVSVHTLAQYWLSPLERKFQKHDTLAQNYKMFMDEYLQLKHEASFAK